MQKLLNWLWGLLPDNCEISGCQHNGVRGNENILQDGRIACDDCSVKENKKEWIVINEFWGGDKYIDELVRHPGDEREVDLSVVNGNVGHGMTGYFKNGEWWVDTWLPSIGSHQKKMPGGITVAAWRELNQ